MITFKYNLNDESQEFEFPEGVAIRLVKQPGGWLGTVIADGETYATRTNPEAGFVLGGLSTYLARVAFLEGDVRLPADVRGPVMRAARTVVFVRS